LAFCWSSDNSPVDEEEDEDAAGVEAGAGASYEEEEGAGAASEEEEAASTCWEATLAAFESLRALSLSAVRAPLLSLDEEEEEESEVDPAGTKYHLHRARQTELNEVERYGD
jgi:hypothetical protein